MRWYTPDRQAAILAVWLAATGTMLAAGLVYAVVRQGEDALADSAGSAEPGEAPFRGA